MIATRRGFMAGLLGLAAAPRAVAATVTRLSDGAQWSDAAGAWLPYDGPVTLQGVMRINPAGLGTLIAEAVRNNEGGLLSEIRRAVEP